MKRTEVIQIRVSPEEKKAIEKAAGICGQKVSDYIRSRAVTVNWSIPSPTVRETAAQVKPRADTTRSEVRFPGSGTKGLVMPIPKK